MSQWLLEKSSSLLEGRTSRRGFLVRSALAGSALAVGPWRYILQPGTAYAAICNSHGTSCDCGSACYDGWTEFCCVVNNGANTCPPGSFEGGWWRADGSDFCGGGARYFVDCNANPGSEPPCSCPNGDCNHRATSCNVFRYGQCHTEIGGTTAIVCRIVSCTPPYEFIPACGTTLRYDNATANHTANCPAPPPPPPPLLPGYALVAAHSGKALDVAGAATNDGARVIQWSLNGGNNQRWLPQAVGDGSFVFVCQNSKRVLDVAGGSPVNGARVIQWQWNGGDNQRWRLYGVGPSHAVFINVRSGNALDVAGGSGAEGAGVVQWEWNGGANQLWRGVPFA
ncbi:MAG: RICIN domain-containing protein [Acidimicrobiales bacterium]